ncbi:MAG: carbon starvation protein A [Elusimicrobiaceae bacterium]
MNALTLIFVSLCVLAIGYRYYGLFITAKVLGVDASRPTPALTHADGHDYHKTNRFVLFGHHFAAIAAAGPLMGPVLAAQFGYLPGTLWILIGVVLAGAVHDTVVLFASIRHNGKSLAHIAKTEMGRTAGAVTSVAVLFILILSLAGLSLAVVNAMANSPWSTFMVFSTMPIALLMGYFLYKVKPGDVTGTSILGVSLLFIAILAGPYVAANPTLASAFTFPKRQICYFLAAYGVIASVLPVWVLLCPRDYLSSYLKIGTISMLALGIVYIHPQLQMPALTQFIHGGGPIIPGSVFPFVFITIACGAISGFHSIIAAGTTPKMISSERDILFIGYGSMLLEGFVAIMALIAACVLVPADYFAINASAEAFGKLGLSVVNLPELSRATGEQLAGRTGGGVSLAVGMSYIFSSMPLMKNMMSYWYHFAIMFEALFILTAVDTGTRVGRFLLQEVFGVVFPQFKKAKWMPGVILTSLLFTGSWFYLVLNGDISTIWPIFGMSNQLLASTALLIGTVLIMKMGKTRYAWVTAVPAAFMLVVTITAGYQNIFFNYLPRGNYMLAWLSLIAMMLVFVILVATAGECFRLLFRKRAAG